MGTLNICTMSQAGGNDQNLPILRPAGVPKDLTTSGASANTTIPAEGDWLRLIATVQMRVKLSSGASVAGAGDYLIPAGIAEYLPIDNFTHINAIEA